MYCPGCRKQVTDKSGICIECGARVVGSLPSKRRNNSVWVTLAGLGFVCVVLFAIVAPVVMRARVAFVTQPCCENNTKELAVALALYSNDYDGKLPLSAKWCDLSRDYVRNQDDFICPAARRLRSGYGINSNLKMMIDDDSDADTVMLFESDKGWNAHGGKEAMLTQPRHGVINIAFMDTHTQYISSDNKKHMLWHNKLTLTKKPEAEASE